MSDFAGELVPDSQLLQAQLWLNVRFRSLERRAATVVRPGSPPEEIFCVNTLVDRLVRKESRAALLAGKLYERAAAIVAAEARKQYQQRNLEYFWDGRWYEAAVLLDPSNMEAHRLLAATILHRKVRPLQPPDIFRARGDEFNAYRVEKNYLRAIQEEKLRHGIR